MADITITLADQLSIVRYNPNSSQAPPRVLVQGTADEVPIEIIDDGFGPQPVYLITSVTYDNQSSFKYLFSITDDHAVTYALDMNPRQTRVEALVPGQQFRFPRGQWGLTLESNWASRVMPENNPH